MDLSCVEPADRLTIEQLPAYLPDCNPIGRL
jgi:hypothetical protein